MGGCSQKWPSASTECLVLAGGTVLAMGRLQHMQLNGNVRQIGACTTEAVLQILLLGGVIWMAPLDCRMVDAGFYCPGLPHPGVEALTAMTNKLLMHFGCMTALGNLLRTSYSLLLLELGVSFQPLQSLYQQFSFLATHK
jgi:hypothetical protein